MLKPQPVFFATLSSKRHKPPKCRPDFLNASNVDLNQSLLECRPSRTAHGRFHHIFFFRCKITEITQTDPKGSKTRQNPSSFFFFFFSLSFSFQRASPSPSPSSLAEPGLYGLQVGCGAVCLWLFQSLEAKQPTEKSPFV